VKQSDHIIFELHIPMADVSLPFNSRMLACLAYKLHCHKTQRPSEHPRSAQYSQLLWPLTENVYWHTRKTWVWEAETYR